MAQQRPQSEAGAIPQAEPAQIRDSWVQCDRCDKWRRIPASVADSLDEDAPWYCEYSVGKHNSCSMPQEMTDAEIDDTENNHSLEVPTAEALLSRTRFREEQPNGGSTKALSLLRRTPVWQLVTEKIYTYRRRHAQEEDDIMICQCPHIWPSDTTTIGCGEHCLNRMLNIECVAEYCPCGDRCTNQQFTRREYAALDVRPAGAKGYGLFTKDGVKAGQFIVEYVGEVLDEEEYGRRKSFYIAAGQRHYYFMSIGNGEVIDACRKGGLGRFINHSCDPNCETQKWQVGGELSIGLFALKDVPPGGELTFDYNFERYGDKPIICLCGAANCRGVIGGSSEDAKRTSNNVFAETTAVSSAQLIGSFDPKLDPEPVMLTGTASSSFGVGKAALERLLDRIVGLGAEQELTPAERKVLASLRHSAIGHEFDDDIEEESMKKGALKTRQRGIVATSSSQDDKESDSSATSHAHLSDSAVGPLRKEGSSVVAQQEQPGALSSSDASELEDATTDERSEVGEEIGMRQRRRPGSTSSSRLGLDNATSSSRAAAAARVLAATPRRVRTPSPTATPAGRGSTRRSEVDRRLDGLVDPGTGRLRDASSSCVLGLLRLFNLCDVGALLVGLGRRSNNSSVPNSTPTAGQPLTIDSGAALRLRARLADLSLLLEVLLRTRRPETRKELVRCGALQQLLSVLGGGLAASSGTAEATITVKLLRATRSLCNGPDDLKTARSAHGNFLDEIRCLVRHSARSVRDAAFELLRAVVPQEDVNSTTTYGGGAGGGGQYYAAGGVAPSSASPLYKPSTSPYSVYTPAPIGYHYQAHSGGLVSTPLQYGSFGGSRGPAPIGAFPTTTNVGGANTSQFGGPASFFARSPSMSRFADRATPTPSSMLSMQQRSHSATMGPRASPILDSGVPTGSPRVGGAIAADPRLGSCSSVVLSEQQQPPRKKRSRWDETTKRLPTTVNGSTSHREGAQLQSNSLTPISSQVLPAGGKEPLSLGPATTTQLNDHPRNSYHEGLNGSSQPTTLAQQGDKPPAAVALSVSYDDPSFFSARMPQRDVNSWDEPDQDFVAYVSAVVACRMGKYLQPGHPSHMSRLRAEQLHDKLTHEICSKEVEAFQERQATHLFKAIEKDKIDTRVKEYVRDSVHRLAAVGGLEG